MITIDIPNRPFATDVLTGLMMPDGIFESSLGKQQINAHYRNVGAAALNDLTLYIESVSHPGIVFTPRTFTVGNLGSGVSTLHTWDVDVSAAPAGHHYVSFIARTPAATKRMIKKIFVTKVEFNPVTKSFSAQTPEGVMNVKLDTILDYVSTHCCKQGGSEENVKDRNRMMRSLTSLLKLADGKREICPIAIVPSQLTTSITPTPYFTGQYGDLPFNDPWWKVVIAIIAFLLLVAAAIVEATSGTGSVTATYGCTIDPSTGATVCGPSASGGGSSYVAAGLVAAAAVVAGIAAYSDERDLHRIGQDNTNPGAGESTIAEKMVTKIQYPEPIAPGKPFAVNVEYEYHRITKDSSLTERVYTHSGKVTHKNIHVLSRYEVHAPDVIRIYKKEQFIVRARFFDEEDKLLRGDSLLVKCFLFGPAGAVLSFVMEDDGSLPDQKPNDGTYTGRFNFSRNHAGLWKILVIAQDVNHATPDMEPEEAAQIIGGMLMTNQVTISFDGGSCPVVPDGDVQVIV